MTATLTLRVNTGTSPGSLSQAQTGIDLETADNSTNTLANRQSNPITVPSGAASAFSYEKWCLLRVDVAPANFVQNFKAYSAQGGTGGAGTGVTLEGEFAVTSYTTPVTTDRVGATALPTTSGAAGTWDSSQYSSVAQVTKYLVLQLTVLSTASPGNMAQATVNYTYDEL
jgi:hypothetical protein